MLQCAPSYKLTTFSFWTRLCLKKTRAFQLSPLDFGGPYIIQKPLNYRASHKYCIIFIWFISFGNIESTISFILRVKSLEVIEAVLKKQIYTGQKKAYIDFIKWRIMSGLQLLTSSLKLKHDFSNYKGKRTGQHFYPLQKNILAFKFSFNWCNSDSIRLLYHDNIGLFLTCIDLLI